MRNATDYFNSNMPATPEKFYGRPSGMIKLPGEDLEVTEAIALTPRIGIEGFSGCISPSAPAMVANFGDVGPVGAADGPPVWDQGAIIGGRSRWALRTWNPNKKNSQNAPNYVEFRNLVVRNAGVVLGNAQTTSIDGLTVWNFSNHSAAGLVIPSGSHSHQASRVTVVGRYVAGPKKTANRRGAGILIQSAQTSLATVMFHHCGHGIVTLGRAMGTLSGASMEHVQNPFRFDSHVPYFAAHNVQIHSCGNVLIDLTTTKDSPNRDIDLTLTVHNQHIGKEKAPIPQYYRDHTGKPIELFKIGRKGWQTFRFCVRHKKVEVIH